MAKATRQYSRDFTPGPREKRRQLHIDRIPAGLHAAFTARARRDGVSIRSLVLSFLRDWAQHQDIRS